MEKVFASLKSIASYIPPRCISNADFEKPGRSFYTEKSGTSMATPVVSGSLALLLSKERALTNKEVKLRLRSSCLDLGLPRNRQGWGQIWVPGLLGL